MARMLSSATTFSSCSHAKKVSPASPDQSVPSQSKTATLGSRVRIESMNALARSTVLDGDTNFILTYEISNAKVAWACVGFWQRSLQNLNCTGSISHG